MAIRIFTSRSHGSGLAGPQAQHPLRGGLNEGSPVVPSSRGRGSGLAGPQAQRPLGGQLLHEVKSVGALNYPPLRIMSKNSWLFLVAFMFLSMSSIDSISSMLYMN